MIYTSDNGIEIDFQPWFDNKKGQHRFTYIHLYEELGGSVASGEMGMEMNGSDAALKLDDEERTGMLYITDTQKNGVAYKIPVFITQLDRFENLVEIKFICIKDQRFLDKGIIEIYKDKDIKSVIETLYPGNLDIRTESDIQGSFTYHQNYETSLKFCTRLCQSYKKDSVFSFGWEGLMVKDLMGETNSRNVTEPDKDMEIRGDSEYTQLTGLRKKRNRGLYYQPVNVWENSDTNIPIKDYTEQEPINVRTLMKHKEFYRFNTDFLQHFENLSYNVANSTSDLFQYLTVANYYRMPQYKIGDVLTYKKESNEQNENLNWPYKYYLVRSNEFFLAIDGSDYVDENGYNFSWTTALLGLEESGAIAVGSEEDPMEGKVAEEKK